MDIRIIRSQATGKISFSGRGLRLELSEDDCIAIGQALRQVALNKPAGAIVRTETPRRVAEITWLNAHS
jgi:hypothetical protein